MNRGDMPRNMKMKWNEMDGFVLVQTEGKERTAVEYSELLGAAGFREVQVRRTGKLYDAVLGRK